MREGVCGPQDNRGFTLLEILVAMIVLSIGLLGMAGLTTGIMRGNLRSIRMTTAMTLAQQKMETMRGLGHSGTPMMDNTTTEDYNSIANHGAYKRVTSIEVATPAAGMKTVTVTVFWDGDAHSTFLTTILGH
ncbi:MAG: prepilin-type N-terminal cleavage/methylation domain-containing protein [Thermodesulfobacteriota bacterium]|nr:prepilin-type N-terminal cleavage/methylation domain-containing protein [Thermodesulfobacteriota bacterium]